MSLRSLLAAVVFVLSPLAAGAPAKAAEAMRESVISKDSDYFGFDLRTETGVDLSTCETICLSDKACRAFTYNPKAQWCFLKSDFGRLQPAPGAFAGRIIDMATGDTLGAPPALVLLSPYEDAARQYRDGVVAAGVGGTESASALADAAFKANGDARDAMVRFGAAAALDPDRSALWAGIARNALAIAAQPDEASTLAQAAVSAAVNGYLTSRSTVDRAAALALLGSALDRSNEGRVVIEAYKASLELQPSAETEAALAAARARHGFRVVGNTIDADAETPRACVQFSEDLTDAEYADFIRLDDAPPAAFTAEGREICVDGLRHGTRYRLTLRAGLPSVVGEVLEKPVALNLFVRDRAPSLRFTGDNFVLPGAARRGIPLVSVNAATARLELFRVGDRSLTQLLSDSQFLRALDAYGVERISAEIGAPVWTGELAIEGALNAEATTSIPVDEALPGRKPGVYVMTARLPGDTSQDWDQRATQWFIVSDIGLTTFAGEDGLSVFARSLESAKPLDGVSLKLVARNNEVLGEAVTDDTGRAVFDAGLTRGADGLAPVLVTAAGANDDFMFLDMTRAGFDLSDRGVTGRPAAGALDVLSWTDRGIYRPGETVNAQALARDGAARAVDDMPLVFVFTRPDGVEDARIVSTGGDLGGHAVAHILQDNAQRGAWTVKTYVDTAREPLASQMFLVEDFVPDRAEFTLSGGPMTVGEPVTVDVEARFLYGAPAAGLSLEGEAVFSPTQEWSAHPGYIFGLTDEADSAGETRMPLEGLPQTDEQGAASFEVALDEAPETTRLLAGKVVVRMRENGGRAVERTLPLDIAPVADMIGIKPEFTGGQLPEGATAKFSVIAAGVDGARIDRPGLEWSLVKVEQNYQWYREGTAWRYETVEFTTRVANGTLDAKADAAAAISSPVEWGRYRLEVQEPGGAGAMTSVEFDAGYYVAAASTETPDGLEIALDKAQYQPGDTAQLKISPRFAGEALITIGAERILGTYNVSVPAEGAVVPITVPEDWGAGAYVTATLFRPGADQESRMPSRAIGVKWLGIDPAARKLAVSIEAPERVQPDQEIEIPVTVTGVAPGEEAYLTLAAVDVGILNLTDYAPPAPDDWYFGQRRLGLEIRDLYGRLIDGSLGVAGKLRTGGDGPTASSKGSPPTEKLLSLFSGIVRLDAEGKARIPLALPLFNGTARLMAVAWSGEGVGHSVRDMVIRDPVVIMASAPRFLASGDETRLLLEIANTDGPVGDYAVAVESEGGLVVGEHPATLALAAGERTALSIPVTGGTIGDAGLRVRLSHPSGLVVDIERGLPVRPQALPVTTRHEIALAANGGKVTIDRELLTASLLDGASVSVAVSGVRGFDVPALLMGLDRYPYGCAEQTTSRALPLLYVSELAAGAGIEQDADLKPRIEGAIARVLNYQSSAGSFGLWGPGGGDPWLDAYVTDFLTRAREQGYAVPERAMMLALDNLQNVLAYETDAATRGSEIAYALYVLARNRRASMSDLRYYSESALDDFASPMARAQIAASLALYDDKPAADRAFASAMTLVKAGGTADMSRSDYGSPLRDGAAVLALAAESRPLSAELAEMARAVGAAGVNNGHSTQDQAWMLLAARALAEGNAALALGINGEAHQGAFAKRYAGEEIAAAPLVLENRGAAPVTATVTAIATPAAPLPAGGTGFSIERRYYTLDGKEASIAETAQNGRFVVVVNVTEHNSWPSRLLVTDLLPAGFEIDNPRLVGSADLPNFPWLGSIEAAHVEYRDDRFVAAFNRSGSENRSFSFAYVVRAVTPGEYVVPAATVEDMYRPQLSARTATGRMVLAAN